MISLDLFLMGLVISSAMTGLTTEAFKRLFAECNVTYKSNVLAGFVAVVLSGLLSIAYMSAHAIGFNVHSVTCLIAQMFLSWLCAMVGYDKVIQTISQFKSPK